MKKVNFLNVYKYDSGTEEERWQAISHQYEQAAMEASDKAGVVLSVLIRNNPEIDSPWHFRLRKK